MSAIHKFIIIFWNLSVLDIITTKIALDTKDVIEYNLIMNLVVHNLPLFLLVKIIGFTIVILLSIWCYNRDKRITNIGMIIIIIMYIGIIINNTYWILK